MKLKNIKDYVGHITTNSTIVDLVATYLRGKKYKKRIYDSVNHVRLHKQAWLPCELCGFSTNNGYRRRLTDCATHVHSGSLLYWWFMRKNVETPETIDFKRWNAFVKWLKHQKFNAKNDISHLNIWK